MVSRAVFLLAAVAATLAGLVAAQDTLDDLYTSLYNLTENKNTVAEPVTSAPVAPAQTIAPIPPDQRYTCTGECVQYYLCSDNQIITDGAGIIDIRVGEDPSEESECPHFLNTCCEKESVLTEPPASLTTPKPPPATNGGGGGGGVGGGSVGGVGGGSGGGVAPKRQTCGYRNAAGLGFRITGNKGGESEYGEFPWMLAVLREERVADNNLNVYECGGSLIAPDVVLTAAHCVFNKQKDQLIIRAGEWDTQTRGELHPHQDRRVAEVITHKAFNKGSLANDVALLILAEPFLLAENVQPVCLPPKDTSFDASKCFASGWGKNVFGKEGKYQVILKKVELPVVPHATCQQSLRTTRLGKRFVLHPSFLCAGGVAGQDTCRGDGGSPLVCPVPGSATHYYQAGIVAWGIGCGENGIPGVYVNVASFRDWIDQQLVEHSILAREYVYTP